MKSALKLVLLATSACTSTGVGNPGIGKQDQALIVDGSDAMEAGDTSSALTSISTLALTEPAQLVDSEAAAGIAETRTALYFEPAGCLVTTREVATVTFDFQGCRTGAFGLSELTGQLVATYGLDTPGTIDVSVATVDFEIGRARVELQAQSFLTIAEDKRTLVWNGSYRAVRPLRPDIDHQTTYVATYDTSTQCLTLDGSATTLFDTGHGVETSITDYLRCGPRGTCPLGGTLALTALPARDRSLTLHYNGDATARIQGRDSEVQLECRP
jgi:hypothetical protein